LSSCFRAYRPYPHHSLFGPSADPLIFRFCQGELHDGNILISPTTGEITGIIDWEYASFCPWWTDVAGVGWLAEDRERFLFGADHFASDGSDPLNSRSDGCLRAFSAHNISEIQIYFSVSLVEWRCAPSFTPRQTSRTIRNLFGNIRGDCQRRRGPFPFDMTAWDLTRIMLDEMEKVRLCPSFCTQNRQVDEIY